MVTRAVRLLGAPTVIGVDDTLPKPTVSLEGVSDLTDHSASMELVTVTGVTTVIAGVEVNDTFEFAVLPADTVAPIFWRSYVAVTNLDGVYTLPGFPIAVVDYALLWAAPADVAAIADESFTNEELVFAILAAEEAVRAWVATSITSPVSERVRRAVALLAARALTTSSEGSVTFEQMGDYQVRYATPQPAGLTIDGEVERLLGPWSKGNAYSVDIGPDDLTTGFFGSGLYSEV